jgi:AcrR family transcriptional regulator
MAAENESKRRTAKSERTRASLIAAARTVIAQDGFANARIVDIAAAAGNAVGVFYTYFSNKDELFAALIDEFFADLENSSPDPHSFAGNPYDLVSESVVAFWTTSKKYRAEIAGLFEIAHADPVLLEIWRTMRARGMRQFAAGIRRQKALGYCEHLDPVLGASALMGLLEFACFNWLGKKLDFPAQEIDERQAIDSLVAVVSGTLQITPDKQAADARHVPAPRTRVKKGVSTRSS